MIGEGLLVLLQRSEGETVDFKEQQYVLDSTTSKSKFIKDIISLANTPRDVDAHIVIGVRKHPDGTYEVIGVDDHPDDASLQDQLGHRVHPVPSFHYEPVSVQGLSIGIISIPARRAGPSLPVKDYGVLRKHTMYFRRGAKNDTANSDEQSRIHEWFAGPSSRGIVPACQGDTPWEQFLHAVHNVDPSRIYLLMVGPVDSAAALGPLGLIPWLSVIDFDPRTQTDGVYSTVAPVLEATRQVHLITSRDRISLNIDRGTYWYTARGLSGIRETRVDDTWLAWNRKYGNDVRRFFTELAKVSAMRPVTLVCMWSKTEFAQSIFEAADAAFGEAVEFVVAVRDPSLLAEVAERFDGKAVAIRMSAVAAGVEQLIGAPTMDGEGLPMEIPTRDGVPKAIPPAEVPWLLEELEVVHRRAGESELPGRRTVREFLLGATPTWYEIGVHCDVDRDVADRLLRRVRSDLDSQQTTRVNLYHAGGAGGTTLARRIAWEVHRRNPTVILHRIAPAETVARLEYLFQQTSQPMLIVAEGASVTDRQTEELFSLMRSRQVSGVSLQVLRRFRQPEEVGDRTFWLASPLSRQEADRFAFAYGREAPDRANQLNKLVAKVGQDHCTPFYFGLEAFGDDFRGLTPYVSSRLDVASDTQRRMLVYLALAYYYAQQTVPIQAFAPLIGLSPSSSVSFEKCFPPPASDLLILEADGICRITHQLIAAEILRQLLAPGGPDPRVWRRQLSHWAREFAQFCADTAPVVSERVMELLRRIFIYRDNVELLGRSSARFSQLIEDIPSREGRAVVLARLTELFPDEAHFWAHLGRFHSLETKDFPRAEDAIERAIQLSPEDHVLYHMKGMALRSWVFDAVGRRAPVQEVVQLVREASAEFARARELAPDEEHGYISEAQLLIRVADYVLAQEATKVGDVMSALRSDPWTRELPLRVEELLDAVRRLRQGERESRYEEECRTRLNALYRDHDLVVEGWSNLLSRPDVYRPPIRRQLVWAYLAQSDRSWDSLAAGRVRRIVELIDANMEEEPMDSRNLRLWVQAVRRLDQTPSLDSVIERLSYWAADSSDIEPLYYLYIFQLLKATEGSPLALEAAELTLEKCRNQARERRNRTRSFEWLGVGTGIGRLVHQSRLGEWDAETQFWTDVSPLARVNGVIREIRGPQAGSVELESGMRAFVVPKLQYVRGRDENRPVTCLIGFSYDGPRGWDLHPRE